MEDDEAWDGDDDVGVFAIAIKYCIEKDLANQILKIIEDASKTCSNGHYPNDHSDDYNFKRRDHQP